MAVIMYIKIFWNIKIWYSSTLVFCYCYLMKWCNSQKSFLSPVEAIGTVVGLSIPLSSLFSWFFIDQLYSMLSRSHYLEWYLCIIIQIQWFLGENVESSLYPSVLVYYIFFTISNSFFIVFRKILKYYVKVIFPYNFK